MTTFGERRFEFATDGSNFSEALCHVVLEGKADSLAGGQFRASPLGLVQETRKWFYLNDMSISVDFVAQKYTWDEEGNPIVMYNPSVTFTRPRQEGEYWPETEIELREDTDESEIEYGMLSVVSLDEAEEIEEVDELALCYIQEVWDYYLEDEDYRPRKNIRREYYYQNYLLGVVSVESSQTSETLLDDDMDVEVALRINNAAMYQSFSELDIDLIEAICDFDFQKIHANLESMGCFDESIDEDQAG